MGDINNVDEVKVSESSGESGKPKVKKARAVSSRAKKASSKSDVSLDSGIDRVVFDDTPARETPEKPVGEESTEESTKVEDNTENRLETTELPKADSFVTVEKEIGGVIVATTIVNEDYFCTTCNKGVPVTLAIELIDVGSGGAKYQCPSCLNVIAVS